ncbi:tRNA (adenosine(37)-N6)-threonylcarbamoyltransferase complex transferase subunit TsaD [Aporhodopirellula aestuarii]|uniref:tRNA N6-adenosine threonylcarbamoyltransferase n=1 Tax=Aporhodopirellula aestuarii TaxID=2950107 RepID=A0ABT0UB71_9BACT|nr:tRNA (adenosine(37)-N6)-threonylcarbamoyltransferase complex transferase subunit TsaD [Aporhodopirellula aestuarii]MCM2373765.1 tRNA (adenosine(37)-N6)-threonylcarbamoyltransferase complex transferase subunit TsaD [Aporhodopirellula aestuarii]
MSGCGNEDVLLAIESTCDETAAAVVTRSGRVLGECIATQEKLHEQFGGVVPEIAARAHLERILPVIDTSLHQAGISGSDLQAIAVADRPGLAGSLLVGVVAAKSLAMAWQKPLVAINHLHAHLYACQLSQSRQPTTSPQSAGQPDSAPDSTSPSTVTTAADEKGDTSVYPAIGLIVSGGHTTLYLCRDAIDLTYLGGTIDDAAGEAFDKVATMLSLGFPGGVAVAKWAEQGNDSAFAFPRSMQHDGSYDFSFSGLKTAVRYAIVGPGRQDFSSLELTDDVKADVCASFEAAVVDVLVAKSRRAISEHGVRRLLVGGGVAANRRLRRQLTEAAQQDGFDLVIAPPELCTDNAVMGAIAWKKIDRGEFASLDLDITPGLQRGF